MKVKLLKKIRKRFSWGNTVHPYRDFRLFDNQEKVVHVFENTERAIIYILQEMYTSYSVVGRQRKLERRHERRRYHNSLKMLK